MVNLPLRARVLRWDGVPKYLFPLMVALQLRNADTALLSKLEAAEWSDLLSFADLAHLTLLLSQLPSGVLPGWVASRIQQNVSDNTKRIGRVQDVYKEAATEFSKANIDHLVIKGFTQYPGYVKSPNLRMQSDIDIFCPAHAILSAQDILAKLGYKAGIIPKHAPVDHLPPMKRMGEWQWRGNHFDPEMPPLIELHYCLWNEEAAQFSIREFDQFWYRRIIRRIDDFSYPALDTADHLAYSALHVLRGLIRGDWVIHHVYELAYFLHTNAHNDAFWKHWRQLHSQSLQSLATISFYLAKLWFDCDLPGEVITEKSKLSPAVMAWFQLFSSSPLEWMFTPNRDSVWLHLSLVEPYWTKISVARKALLPGRVPSFDTADASGPNNRWSEKNKSPYRFVRYAGYVAERVNYYARVLFGSVWRGSRWWLAQKQYRTKDSKIMGGHFLPHAGSSSQSKGA